jgi:ribosomal protein S17
MNRSKLIAAMVVAVGLAAPAPLPAQVRVSAPIVLKQKKPKTKTYKGTVVSATMLAITVRSEKDERMIQTFRLSPEASQRMVKVLERGGYVTGDKVKVVHHEGTDLAIEVKGKPSSAR